MPIGWPVAPGSSGAQGGGDIRGIRCVDPNAVPAWKPALSWWTGGRLTTTKPGEAVLRKIAPIEARLMQATRRRIRINIATPVVILTSTGARSGERQDTPLTYLTDGGDVILIASNYGGERHPAWYYNLRAHPECELHIGPHGGRFMAREVDGADRQRLYGLAEKLARTYAHHAHAAGDRTIPVLRLTPV
jgi:deazaflavin-dependent oxidoreductase (nitroreductase family)